MAALFADIPEALENTLEIAEKCNLELRLGNPTPPNYKFTHTVAGARGVALEEESDYSHANDAILFETLCREKLENRLRYVPAENHETYRARLDREIAVIKQMKFAGYMLIVWDFVNKAKELKIPVGPGRGSAAGSLVAFALEITNIDPMKYGLLFERFLNPERISMPDIDMDFCQARRGEVIDYVVSQYGRENVAQVITFNSLLAKGVIRDTARILDIPIPEADRMAKLIPKELQITLEKAIAAEPKLRELVESDANAAEIWRLALQLEGLKRQAGVHAAGLVISNEPLWHKTPLYRPSGTEDVVTQYDGHYLEDVDLIKFDFLGLQTLSVIDHALGLIAKTHEPIDLDIMETNDSGVFELISTGNTLGIFQIESEGLRNLSRRLKPTCFEDIIAMIALYRPGPLESGMVDDFVDRKHGRAATTYMFPALEPILAPTYGVIVYQEQVMQIVQTIGGFSLGKADLVRRAMGKKDDDLMNKMRIEFAEGAEKQGYDNHKAQELFELIGKFAGYGFNKSHSAAYAMLTYQTAYLKRYYPAEFMSAMLTFDSAHSDKVATYIQEAKRMGIDILPPDINRSQIDFEPLHDGEASKVIFGMGAIKGVGSIALEIIIKARQEQGGRFATIIDFLSQVDSQKVNKKVFEALIKAGALDGFGFSRRAMLGAIDKIVTTAQNANNIRKEVRGGLFDDEAETMASAVMIDIPNLPELDDKVILEFEKESLGLYVSGHPLDEYRDELSKYTYALSASIEEIEDGSEVVFIGKVENIENKISKKLARYGVVHLIDLTGSPELMIFERDMEKLDKLWKEDSARPIAFRVNVDKNGDRVGLRVRRVLALEELANDKPQPPRRNNYNNYNREKPKESEAVKQPPIPMTLEIAGGSNPQVIEELYRIIKANPGVKPVMVRILTENSEIEMVTRLSASELVRDEVVKIGVKYKG
ncbi:hypothetical protein AGMMS49521_4020 [Campylobacterota bacterium]|nr:hypothetical protein AGMMS49521_4020 [Campylobacterota bacterium]